MPTFRALLLVALLPLLPLGLACEPVKVGNLAEPGPNAVVVEVNSTPAGATVVVDGSPIGPAPQSVKLNPGPHTVKAMKSGYFPQEQKLVVSSGAPAPKLSLTLVASH